MTSNGNGTHTGSTTVKRGFATMFKGGVVSFLRFRHSRTRVRNHHDHYFAPSKQFFHALTQYRCLLPQPRSWTW